PVAAEVALAEVVDDDENDVGLIGGACGSDKARGEENCGEEVAHVRLQFGDVPRARRSHNWTHRGRIIHEFRRPACDSGRLCGSLWWAGPPGIALAHGRTTPRGARPRAG